MAVRSKRLWGPSGSAGAGTPIYTCPADETTIVKQINYVNNAAIAVAAALYLDGGLGGNIIDSFTVPGTGSLVRSEQFIVLQPGQTLRLAPSGGGVISAGFGAQLEGVAD